MGGGSVLDAALKAAQLGWHVFPVEPRGKRPLVKWRDESTTDPVRLTSWWEAWPDANIGIDTGKSDLLVVDVDPGGQLPFELPATLEVTTGRGRHLYYAGHDGIGNSASKLAPNVDTRGDGGYVLGPGSVHPSGATYEVVGNRWPTPTPDGLHDALAAKPAPAPAVAAAAPGTAWGAKVLEGEAGKVAMAPEGQRNQVLFTAALKVIGACRGGHLDPHQALAALTAAARRAGLEDGEIGRTIDSARQRADERHPAERDTPPSEVDTGPSEGWTPLTVADLLDMPPPSWLVPGICVASGLTFMVGEQKLGKTFLALDAALTLAQHERVLYFAGEGVSGLGVRVEAWLHAHPGTTSDKLLTVPFVPRVGRPGDPDRYLRTVQSHTPALVVIDTFARSMAGLDENSALDVGRFVDMVDRAREETGNATMVLHHPTKNGGVYRGNGAIAGAVDLLTQLRADEDLPGTFSLSYEDVKDFEPPQSRIYQLRASARSAVVYPSALGDR
jgi:hypothetical protein